MKQAPGKIVIFGQYKSGTTGVFTKIRNSLPADTRTLFEPLAYNAEDQDANRWVLAKTILKFVGHPEPVDYDSFLGFDRRIYLVRDPRDWLVSFTLFLCQEKPSIFQDDDALRWVMDYLKRKEAQPRQLPLKALLDYLFAAPPAMTLDFFAERTRGLQAFCMGFEERLGGNAVTLRYEDFVDGRLAPLSDYLELELAGDAKVDRQYAHVPRTCAHGDWKNWLTAEDERVFRPYFDDYIRHYGYQADWRTNDAPRIDPAHGSEYVERVVRMKRQRLAGQG
ncbi:hypothetical protein [Thiocystis violacea]|uniref:hypothetical protein n=1 Tax=Thiocystis violacea TaxID=13725 RepID=UPI001904CD7E|nr:hypothetical protein [Thiocystis violacea]MBK1724478.1 hypothetical protein [Thiocystis violacea]